MSHMASSGAMPNFGGIIADKRNAEYHADSGDHSDLDMDLENSVHLLNVLMDHFDTPPRDAAQGLELVGLGFAICLALHRNLKDAQVRNERLHNKLQEANRELFD